MNENTKKTTDQPELFEHGVPKQGRSRNGVTVNFRGDALNILDRAHHLAMSEFGGDVTISQTARFLVGLGWTFVDSAAPSEPTKPDAGAVGSTSKPNESGTKERRVVDGLTHTGAALRSLFTKKGDSYITHVADPALRRILEKSVGMRAAGAFMAQIARGEVVVDGMRLDSIGLVPLGSDAKGREGYRVTKVP